MILDNHEILNNFSLHFNCRLTSDDFTNNLGGLITILNNKDGKIKQSKIILPCDNIATYNQLRQFNYAKLLNEMCLRITINQELLDIYKSEMQPELVQLFISYLERSTKLADIQPNPVTLSFEIVCHDLLVNLVISAFSQFHTAITGQLDHFNKLIEINSRTSGSHQFTDNLFLNSKAPTAFSYFVLAYLAENLNIKLKI